MNILNNRGERWKQAIVQKNLNYKNYKSDFDDMYFPGLNFYDLY